MHWILSSPNNFSLTRTIRRSQDFLLPPFGVNQTQGQLERVERLASKHTVALTISQVPAGLQLEVHQQLTGDETEEISHKTWRMLRLGENFTPFLLRAREDPLLRQRVQQGARFLRGATFFEDLVKALIVTHSPQHGEAQIAWLVDRLGDSLPSNPTRHAFPTPQQFLWNQLLLNEILGRALGQTLHTMVERFQAHGDKFETLIHPRLPLKTVETCLTRLLGLDNGTLALAMLALGRYDYLPTALHAPQARNLADTPGAAKAGSEEILARLRPWQPWGGLVYWLWDWTAHLAQVAREGESNVGGTTN